MRRKDGKPGLWLYLIASFTAAVLVAPALVVIPMGFSAQRSLSLPTEFSLRWYEAFFTDPKWMTALQNSLVIAVIVTICSVIVGTMASFAIVRGRFRGRPVLEVFGLLPLIVPIVVFGIATYALFLKWNLVGTVLGFVVAHTVLTVPYVLVTVTSTLRLLNPTLEYAAAVLGASKIRTLRRVTLPMLIPGMLGGGLFAFVTSFDEVVVSLFIANPRTRTLPVEMYASVTRDIDPTIASASTMILVVSTALIMISATFIFNTPRKRKKN